MARSASPDSGDSQFFIKADTSMVTVSDDIEFEQMGFFEGGDEDADNAPDDWTDVRLHLGRT